MTRYIHIQQHPYTSYRYSVGLADAQGADHTQYEFVTRKATIAHVHFLLHTGHPLADTSQSAYLSLTRQDAVPAPSLW